MVRLLSMDQFSIIDKIRKCIVHRKKTNIVLKTSLCSPLVKRTSRIERIDNCSKKNMLFNFVIGAFIARGCHERITFLPSKDRTHNIGKRSFTCGVMYYIFYKRIHCWYNWFLSWIKSPSSAPRYNSPYGLAVCISKREVQRSQQRWNIIHCL
jgi:hypothetical protein